MWRDVQDYVQHCDTCQHTNDVKFQKQAAALHPISVKSKVWNQVCIYHAEICNTRRHNALTFTVCTVFIVHSGLTD